MFIYYFLFIIPGIWCVLFKEYKVESYKKIAIFTFFIVLFLILALRGRSIGIDLKNYENFYNTISKLHWNELPSTEYGYWFLNKVISLFSAEFQWFIICTALISVVPIAYVYLKEVEIPYLMIVLFLNMSVFVLMFSGLRQSIAISLGMFSYLFVKKRKLLFFIISVFFAALFHQSALILLLMYPVYHLKITKNHLYLIVPLMIISYINSEVIFNNLLQFLNEKYAERYSELGQTGAYSMIILFALFALFSYYIVDENKMDKEITGLRNLMLLSLSLQMFASVSTIAMRMNYYFIIFVPILIPGIIKRCSGSKKTIARWACAIMEVFFTVYFFYNAYFGADILQVFPYNPFWEVL